MIYFLNSIINIDLTLEHNSCFLLVTIITKRK